MPSIIIVKDPPPPIIPVITQYYKTDKIKKVTITTDVVGFDQYDISGYLPDKEEVIIDLKKILSTATLKGTLLLPSVWLSLMRAVFHELGHALQVERDPEIIKEEILPEEYETEANQFAYILMENWFKYNKIPPLDFMGWMGYQIKSLIEALYPNHSKLIKDIEIAEAGAVISLDSFALHYPELVSKEQCTILSQDQSIGITIEGVKYLDAISFITAINNNISEDDKAATLHRLGHEEVTVEEEEIQQEEGNKTAQTASAE